MKTSTHLRLANLVALELGLKLDSEECTFLRGGSIEPDKWKDYPHHFRVNHKLENYIIKSRKYFLDGNVTAHLECLGIAFHYVADKWTLFSGSAQQHSDWENKVDKCKVVSDLNQILLEKLSIHQESLEQYLALSKELYTIPRTKIGTLAFAFSSRPMENGTSYSTPEIDFNIAFRICLAIGMSVRSMTTPPNELMKALNLLTPWGSSKELSERSPPIELEVFLQDCLRRLQPLEKIITEKQEELKKEQSNFLRTFLFRRKLKSSIRSIEYDIRDIRHDLKNQIHAFIQEYAPHINWYYWGEKGTPSLWALEDLFENNNMASRSERGRIGALIQEKTFNELIALRKQNYQLVFPSASFAIKATFDNPLIEKIENVQFYVNLPMNWKADIQPMFFSVPPNGSITPQAKLQIPTEDKLDSYILELRFLLPSATSQARIQEPYNKTICGYPIEETYRLPAGSASNMSFACDRSNFVKLTVVSERIRKDWLQKSAEGVFCAVMGCDNKRLDWKCPKCGFYFCDAHKNHTECEGKV